MAGQRFDQARANARQTAPDATVTRRQAKAAQTVIGAREAAARQVDTTLGDLRIAAPLARQVVNRQVNVGSHMAPGTPLMAIAPIAFE